MIPSLGEPIRKAEAPKRKARCSFCGDFGCKRVSPAGGLVENCWLDLATNHMPCGCQAGVDVKNWMRDLANPYNEKGEKVLENGPAPDADQLAAWELPRHWFE